MIAVLFTSLPKAIIIYRMFRLGRTLKLIGNPELWIKYRLLKPLMVLEILIIIFIVQVLMSLIYAGTDIQVK